mmetsp:Transcript_2890/g.4702  ORF Transcript_2890/g.4702 Transcript_2890/m.4702 type:complete len:334 (+) Transcript_2890:113-1114(+)
MGNNVSDVAACRVSCCEQDELDKTGTCQVRPVGFDGQWKEEVCDMESRNSSWEARQISWESEKGNQTPKSQGCVNDSMKTAENVEQQDEDICCLEFSLRQGAIFGVQLIETHVPQEGKDILVVVQIEPKSPFAKTVDGRLGLAAGDTIVEVNGRRGSAFDLREMLQQVVASNGKRAISLSVRSRPSSFEVELDRSGPLWQKLGIAAAIDKTKRDCLIVQCVRGEGLVPQWNSENGSLRVCAGDLITHVNGITQDARAMCAAISAAAEGSKLCFRVSIPGNSSSRDSRQMEERLSSSSRPSLRSDRAKPDKGEESDVSTASTECGSGSLTDACN